MTNRSMVDPKLTVKVVTIIDKLPENDRQKMADFHNQIENYINSRSWIEENYVNPFPIGFQLYLEHAPADAEDSYRCTLLASGPDIQYYDKRAIFPFRDGEIIGEGANYQPVQALIDYYVYLLIANELDKYGQMEGTKYFEKSLAFIQQGKLSGFAFGWDMRGETMTGIFSDSYKMFRELKDYYFYGLWSTAGKAEEGRKYILQSLERLEKVLKVNRDLIAARQFIDAHYNEIIEIFKGSNNPLPFQILIRIDPDRKETYQEYL